MSWFNVEGARRERARCEAEKEREWLGAVPVDWSDTADVRRYVDFWLGEDHGIGERLKYQLRELWRRNEISLPQALALLDHIPWREERAFKDCLSIFERGLEDGLTEAHQVEVMNNLRVLCSLSERTFRRIRDAVLERGDLRKLGVRWAFVGGHLDDQIIASGFLRKAVRTHALEAIQECGDDKVKEADAYLLQRLEQGLGPEADTSEITAEFLVACHAIKIGDFKPEERIELASQMIMMLVGQQSRADREAGTDIMTSPTHQGLGTLRYLFDIIFNEMTEQNAGIMLRWTMVRNRHHYWVWERIMSRVKTLGWLMVKTERSKTSGKVAAVWRRGSHETIVLQSMQDIDLYGALEPGMSVLIPPFRLLGSPIRQGEGWKVYQAHLQPLRPPTEAMRAALKT